LVANSGHVGSAGKKATTESDDGIQATPIKAIKANRGNQARQIEVSRHIQARAKGNLDQGPHNNGLQLTAPSVHAFGWRRK
jgi:hypothetical protein